MSHAKAIQNLKYFMDNIEQYPHHIIIQGEENFADLKEQTKSAIAEAQSGILVGIDAAIVATLTEANFESIYLNSKELVKAFANRPKDTENEMEGIKHMVNNCLGAYLKEFSKTPDNGTVQAELFGRTEHVLKIYNVKEIVSILANILDFLPEMYISPLLLPSIGMMTSHYWSFNVLLADALAFAGTGELPLTTLFMTTYRGRPTEYNSAFKERVHTLETKHEFNGKDGAPFEVNLSNLEIFWELAFAGYNAIDGIAIQLDKLTYDLLNSDADPDFFDDIISRLRPYGSMTTFSAMNRETNQLDYFVAITHESIEDPIDRAMSTGFMGDKMRYIYDPVTNGLIENSWY